jgi:hypothetical protein
MPLTNREKQAAFKERQAKKGLQQYQVWIYPDDKTALGEFVKNLNTLREQTNERIEK